MGASGSVGLGGISSRPVIATMVHLATRSPDGFAETRIVDEFAAGNHPEGLLVKDHGVGTQPAARNTSDVSSRENFLAVLVAAWQQSNCEALQSPSIFDSHIRGDGGENYAQQYSPFRRKEP